MTKAEEDAALIKETIALVRGTVYLTEQPASLSGGCRMHKYQLEGLNWMIRLHDRGINGILADEMARVYKSIRHNSAVTTDSPKECRRAMEGTQQSAGEPTNNNNNNNNNER